jgi:hypothetical protein
MEPSAFGALLLYHNILLAKLPGAPSDSKIAKFAAVVAAIMVVEVKATTTMAITTLLVLCQATVAT